MIPKPDCTGRRLPSRAILYIRCILSIPVRMDFKQNDVEVLEL